MGKHHNRPTWQIGLFLNHNEEKAEQKKKSKQQRNRHPTSPKSGHITKNNCKRKQMLAQDMSEKPEQTLRVKDKGELQERPEALWTSYLVQRGKKPVIKSLQVSSLIPVFH